MSAGVQGYTPEGGGGVAFIATTNQGSALVISGGVGVGAQATLAAGENVTIPSFPLQLVGNLGGSIDGGKASATLTVPFTSSLSGTIDNTSLNLAFGANPFAGLRVSITCNAQGCSPAPGLQFNTANTGMSLDGGGTMYLALRATIPLPDNAILGQADANGVLDVTIPAVSQVDPGAPAFGQSFANRDLSQFAGASLPQWGPDGSFMGYVSSNADGSVTLHTATADVTTYQGSVLIHQLIDPNTGQRTDQWIQQNCDPGCSGPTTTFDVATNTVTEANTPDGSTVTRNLDTGVVTQTNQDGSTVIYNPQQSTLTTNDGGLVWGIGATTTTYHLLPDGSVGSVTQTGPFTTTTWDSSGQATISSPLGGTVTSGVVPPPTPPPIPDAPVLRDPNNSAYTVTASTAGTAYAYSTDANGNDVVTITAPPASNTSDPSSTAVTGRQSTTPTDPGAFINCVTGDPLQDCSGAGQQSNASNANQTPTTPQTETRGDPQPSTAPQTETPGAPQPSSAPQPPTSGTCWSTTGDGQPQSPGCQPPTTGDGQPQSPDGTNATPVNTNPNPTPDNAAQDNTDQTGASNSPASTGPAAQPSAPPMATDNSPQTPSAPTPAATDNPLAPTGPADSPMTPPSVPAPTENTVVQAVTSAPASPPSNSTSTNNMAAQPPAPTAAPGSNGNAGLNGAAGMTTTTTTMNSIMDTANASNNASGNPSGGNPSGASSGASDSSGASAPAAGGGGGSVVGGDDGQEMAEMDA
jgi:hypothetical protein